MLSCRLVFLLGGLNPSQVIHHAGALGGGAFLEEVLALLGGLVLGDKAFKCRACQLEVAALVGKAPLLSKCQRSVRGGRAVVADQGKQVVKGLLLLLVASR